MTPMHTGGSLSRLFKELQRRSVFKVGVTYLASAWLLLQLIGEIGPILEFPEWFPRVALLVVALGFVVAVVLAWIFELTDQGLRTTTEMDRDVTLRPAFGRTLNVLLVASLTLALGYFIWESRFQKATPTTSRVDSIAVLPFKDLSPAGDQVYFAEGMAEEILNVLSRLPDLKVAGRTSAFAAGRADRDLQSIAAELGVSHMLLGSVRTSGSQLRITAQLVKADDGFQVWSHTFDRELTDVFAVQDDIAALVSQAVRGEDGTASELPQRTRTASMAAYDQYLLGRYHLAFRTGDALERATSHLRAAIEQDPGYAPAWSALAMALVVSPYYSRVDNPQALAQEVRDAARKAIDLDVNNGEAHAVLGTALVIFERDWLSAAEMLQRAVALQPNDATIANLYGDYLYVIGDFESALRYETLAAELDPLLAANQHELALVLNFLGRLEEAVERERLAVRLSPEFGNAWSALARMLLESGLDAETSSLLEQHRDALGQRAALRLEARLLINQGDPDGARELIESSLSGDLSQEGSLTHEAFLFALLGDDERAAELVTLSYERRDPILVSPLYFFLPEDWPGMPQLQAALLRGELVALFDLRRHHIAAGSGRAAQAMAPKIAPVATGAETPSMGNAVDSPARSNKGP